MGSPRPLGDLLALARPRNVTERNFRNVLIDGIGVGLVTGVSTFLPVFLTRLGASSLLIGLITALPALTGALLGVPVGRFLERQPNIVPWYSGMRVWVLWSYVVFGVLPFFVPLEYVPALVIAIWALATVPATFVNVAFTVVMGGVAGPSRRFFLMSLRWSSLGITTAIAVMLVGLALDRLPFPFNYQVVFIASFVGGLLSFLFSRSISLPDRPPLSEEERARQRKGPGAALREGWAALAAYPAFARMTGSAFVFRCGMAMALPLFPIYWVREVGASDAWIGLISTANSAVLLVAYFIWTGLVRRRGVGWVLIASSLGLALYPTLTAATQNVWLLALLAAMAGVSTAGNDLVNFDLVLSHAPSEHQTTYIGLHQTLQNLALFVMPLAGTAMADLVGLVPALLAAGALRLVGTGLYVLLGIGREPAPAPAEEAA